MAAAAATTTTTARTSAVNDSTGTGAGVKKTKSNNNNNNGSKDQRRIGKQSKEALAEAIRREFNNHGVDEMAALGGFLYSAEKRDKAFRARFLDNMSIMLTATAAAATATSGR